MTPELQGIVERLEKIEKQIASLGIEEPDIGGTVRVQHVVAQRFLLVDAEGQAQAMLSASDGDPALVLFHADGKVGLEISISGDGPRIVFFDANGKRRATLETLTAPGGPWLGLFDANGNVRACLGVREEGGLPWLEFYNAKEKEVVQVEVNDRGSEILLFDANQNPRVKLAAETAPWLGLYDAEGHLRLDALLRDEYGPMLFLRDKHTNPSISAQVSEDGPSVSLRDANGKKELNLEVSPSGSINLFMGEHGPNPELATVGPSLKLAVNSEGPCLLFGKDNKVFWSAP